MMAASTIIYLSGGKSFFPTASELSKDLHIVGFAIGGVLIGTGSRLAESCTFGHVLVNLP